MFDLQSAVDAWCQKVIAHQIWEAEKVDELKDHLYCIIESEKQSGKNDKDAFQNATESLGYTSIDEVQLNGTSKDKKVISRICALLNKIEGSKYSDSPLIITHAIIWASMMIASAIVVSEQSSAQNMFWVLLFGWFASFMALDGLKQSARQEWVCLKRKIQ